MFKPQFRYLVLSGEKRQTIRPIPKRMPKAGDLESWREWKGKPYRSKQRELAKVVVTSVQPITIAADRIQLEGKNLDLPDLWKLSHADGFGSVTAMLEWFNYTHGLPFSGILIKAANAAPPPPGQSTPHPNAACPTPGRSCTPR